MNNSKEIIMIKDLETKECIRLLSNNYIGHLAFISQKSPNVIPITYYYDKNNNSIISYSAEGHKINAMRKNGVVSLAVEEIESISHWQSVMVRGSFEELKGIDAKFLLHEFANGVKKNVAKKEHTDLKFISEFSSKLHSEGIPIVYRINILEFTGKRRDS